MDFDNEEGKPTGYQDLDALRMWDHYAKCWQNEFNVPPIQMPEDIPNLTNLVRRLDLGLLRHLIAHYTTMRDQFFIDTAHSTKTLRFNINKVNQSYARKKYHEVQNRKIKVDLTHHCDWCWCEVTLDYIPTMDERILCQACVKIQDAHNETLTPPPMKRAEERFREQQRQLKILAEQRGETFDDRPMTRVDFLQEVLKMRQKYGSQNKDYGRPLMTWERPDLMRKAKQNLRKNKKEDCPF